MENDQIPESDYKRHHEILFDTYQLFEHMYNHTSKSFSEMNNTFNWATTIVIALLVILTKHVPNSNYCIGYLFIFLIILFISFKAINIFLFERKMTKLLVEYSLDCINLKVAVLLDEDSKNLDEEYYNKILMTIHYISISLNVLFILAMIIFMAMVLILLGFLF